MSGVAGLGAWVIHLQLGYGDRQARAIDTKRALYVAEAGLAEAVFAVGQGKSGALASEDVPARFHDGIYWVESEATADGRRVLTSRARVGAGRFAVRLVVRPNVNPVARAGFFGAESVTVGAGVVLDGFDSSTGEYDAALAPGLPFQSTGAGGLLRSNGDIALDGPVSASVGDDAYLQDALALASEDVVEDATRNEELAERLRRDAWPVAPALFATLRPGPGGGVRTNGGAYVQAVEPAPEVLVLPEPVVPLTEKTYPGSRTIAGAEVLADASWSIERLVVDDGATLRLVGPLVLHVEHLEVRSGGVLEIDDLAGPVQVAAEHGLVAEPGSRIDSLHDAREGFGVHLLVIPDPDPTRDDRVALDCIGDLHGVLHAPGDRVRLPAGLRLWGAVAARDLEIAPGAWLTYDRALRVGGAGVPSVSRQSSWQVADDPGAPRSASFDALRALAARGVVPVESADAAPERVVTTRYLDRSGDLVVATGPADALDFTSVSRVVSMSWVDPVTGLAGTPLRPPGLDADGLLEDYRARLRTLR